MITQPILKLTLLSDAAQWRPHINHEAAQKIITDMARFFGNYPGFELSVRNIFTALRKEVK